MSAVTQKAGKVWTEEELQALPDNGHLHEVVNGELVMSPKNTRVEMDDRLTDYFASGGQTVWIIHPE